MNKRIMLPVFAVIAALALVFGASAFKRTPTNSTSELWFEYTSNADPFINNNIYNPENYELMATASEEPPCTADDVFCAIRALPSVDGKPDISGTTGLTGALDDYVTNQNNRNESFIEERVE